MVMFVKGALLTVAVSLALEGIASAQGTLTDAEFKCQTSVSKAGAKFVGSKAKCVAKCITLANKGNPNYPFVNCFAPYGGLTAQCIDDTTLDLKGAEDKFRDAIRKACDPTFKAGTDCPECYSGGDCSIGGEATNRVQNLEVQVDSFGPGVYCEQPGADVFETKCEISTAKALVKLQASAAKCYDKCNSNMRMNKIPPLSCDPPTPSDPLTAICLNRGYATAVFAIDKFCGGECLGGDNVCGSSSSSCASIEYTPCGCNADCGPQTIKPDCANPDDYPTGSDWVNLVETAIAGNIPGTYCGSPSGAFLD